MIDVLSSMTKISKIVHAKRIAHVSIFTKLFRFSTKIGILAKVSNNLYIFIKKILCTVGCPCDGCESCWPCEDLIPESCQHPEQNENSNRCRQMANDNQIICGSKCTNLDCFDDCWNQYQIDIDNCPCGLNCKG